MSRRREPTGPPTERRLPIPWLPVGVLVGVFAVAGLITYLIWQNGQPPGQSAADKVETDPQPDLPGEYVNLPEIYGDSIAPHVTNQVDFIDDGNNPPAGGPMWGSSRCTEDPNDAPANCGPAPWGIYRAPWEPETLNHNMEHAGVVIWYNTSHRDFLDGLEDLALGRLRDGDLLVVTPYPRIEEETIALTSWARIDKFAISEYSEERVEDFIEAHVCRYDAEGFC